MGHSLGLGQGLLIRRQTGQTKKANRASPSITSISSHDNKDRFAGFQNLASIFKEYLLREKVDSGCVVLDTTLQPLCANNAALQILTYPDDYKRLNSLGKLLSREMCARLVVPPNLPVVSLKIKSGNRNYNCKVLSVQSLSKSGSGPTMILFFERASLESNDFFRMSRAFRLTHQEQETVRFLLKGLTSKEIGKQMGISRYTVHTYLRQAMVKMGVSNRIGIIGKFMPLQGRKPSLPKGRFFKTAS